MVQFETTNLVRLGLPTYYKGGLWSNNTVSITMPVQPQNRFLKCIHCQQMAEPVFVSHYDSKSGDLRAWPWYFSQAQMIVFANILAQWPVTQTEAPVHPMNLSEYRSTHQLNNPCCFCTSEEYEDDYTESAIYIPTFGPYSGKFVAGCATNSCGYIGMLPIIVACGTKESCSPFCFLLP